MLKIDYKKKIGKIRGNRTENMVEFAHLTAGLIYLYGKECVQKAFERGCDKSLQEDLKKCFTLGK